MPAPVGLLLSPEDAKLLRSVIEREKRRAEPSLREVRELDYLEQPAPDKYVALIPEGGLPARSGMTPGTAEADIYRRLPLLPGNGELEGVLGLKRQVYNLSTAAIPAGEYVAIARDKFGTWWAESPGGGGAATLSRMATFHDDASNSGSTETDLYSYTMPAATLAADGEVIEARYSGIFQNVPSSPTIKLYFANIPQLNFTGPNTSGSWWIDLTMMRLSNTAVSLRATYAWKNGLTNVWNGDTAGATGLTLASTSYVLKITGQGSASTQITAKMGYVEKKSEA